MINNETSYDLDKEIKEIEKLVNFIIKKEELANPVYSIILVDNERIREINKEYRNIDEDTDVISFALEDNSNIKLDIRVLGDIYISIDKAKKQALEYNHSFLRELSFLVVHGFLHLLGYNHEEKEEEKIMFEKQEEILNEFGIER